VLRQKWSRGQVEARLANMPPCLVGMEACVGALHLSRCLSAKVAHVLNVGDNPYLLDQRYRLGEPRDYDGISRGVLVKVRHSIRMLAELEVKRLGRELGHKRKFYFSRGRRRLDFYTLVFVGADQALETAKLPAKPWPQSKARLLADRRRRLYQPPDVARSDPGHDADDESDDQYHEEKVPEA
jgi:hypothetical protein